MRCEICNRSMTELVLDGVGNEHYYCQHCDEEILDTLSSYEDEEDEWHIFMDEELARIEGEDNLEQYQEDKEDSPD